MLHHKLIISTFPDRYAICRLNPQEEIPLWVKPGLFCSTTRTPDELSIVCPENDVPLDLVCERGWRMLKLEGPLDLTLTGVLVSVAAPLAEAGISIFPIATYETDYVFVRDAQHQEAVSVLTAAGLIVKSDAGSCITSG